MARLRATAVAHPNVALIKYWGKRSDGPANVPAVDSLSITLGALASRSTVAFDPDLQQDELWLDGQRRQDQQGRLRACLDALRHLSGHRGYARVESRNDFPTGAGLASSASGYAALTIAAAAALGMPADEPALVDVARIGSGSAPRSLFGGFVRLEQRGEHTRCHSLLGPADWPLEVVVAVTTEAAKAISSREGMRLSRASSPFYAAWLDTQPDDLVAAEAALAARDFAALADIAEHNCLKMHAVMLSTRPPLLYWSPATLACIQAIRDWRRDGLPVFSSVDAGPQLKAICLPGAGAEVERRLAAMPGVKRTIRGGLGAGARLLRSDA